MKNVLFSLFMLLTLNSSIYGNITQLDTIDNRKKVIQIGMFVENLHLIDCVQKYKNSYDLFTKSYKDFKIVYAVNLQKNKVQEALINIKKEYKDAFINQKIYFVNKNSKMNMPSMLAHVEEGRVDIIQIGMFEKEQNLFDTIKKYGRTHTMMIKPYKNTYISYLMKTDVTKSKNVLQEVQKGYDDAFLNQKIHLYTKVQVKTKTKKVEVTPTIITKEKIVIKYIEKPIKKAKPKFNKPVNMDVLITSFENLPFAIYGK